MSKQRLTSRDRSTVEVILVDANGNNPGSAATPIQTATSTLQTTPDLTLVRGQITTATTTAAIAAAAGLRTRVYRVRLNISGACIVTIEDGATALEIMNFTAAGFLTYDFYTRPWYATSANSALNVVTSAAVTLNYIFEYAQAA